MFTENWAYYPWDYKQMSIVVTLVPMKRAPITGLLYYPK